MTIDMKTIKLPYCQRRSILGKKMLCRTPRNNGMSPREYITYVRNNPTHQVNYNDCLKCSVVDHSNTISVSLGESTIIPPKKSQETHVELLEITSNGTLKYARKGWEPPSIPPGYKRKSSDLNNDDAWILVPQIKCKHLKLNQLPVGGCGCIRIELTCTYNDHFIKIHEHTCTTCKHKEPNNE